jgi:hypothetical protein
MIRVKCPKCAISLAFEDDEAGEPGECTECGARFRVPAPKAGRPKPAEERLRKGPSRRREEEEVDDEDEDEDEEDEAAPKRPIKSKGTGADLKSIIQLSVGLLLGVILLGVGGIYIKNLGTVSLFAAVAGIVLCGWILAKMAVDDSAIASVLICLMPVAYVAFVAAMLFDYLEDQSIFLTLMVMLGASPIYYLFWSISHWDRAKVLCVICAGCLLLFFAGYFSSEINAALIKRYREQTRQKVDMEFFSDVKKK